MNRSSSMESAQKRVSYAPAGQATLHNLIVSSSMTLNHRRYADPDFLGSRKRSRHDSLSGSRSNANASFYSPEAESHRSVHTLVPAIVERCRVTDDACSCRNDVKEGSDPVLVIAPPEEECYLLAYWALVDSYNKAVICSMGGVEAVIQAMQKFPDSTGLQECGCRVLGNLARDSPCLSLTVERAGGVEQILKSALRHPSSVAVQTAVCDALESILTVVENKKTVLTKTSQVLETSLMDLLRVLSHASSMVLSHNKHKTAEELLVKIARHTVTSHTKNDASLGSSPAPGIQHSLW